MEIGVGKVLKSVHISVAFFGLLVFSGCAWQGAQTNQPGAVLPQSGMVASAHPLATAAGLDVLRDGGNAFDAAVTVAAVLAVVEPFGSGIGGGGFWLLHQQQDDRSIFVDAREAAPSRASESMYVINGEVDRELATNHPLAAGIPGTPAALEHIQTRYGTLSLERLLAPAIRLARQGFAVTSEYQDAVKMRLAALQQWRASSVFLDNGKVPEPGWVLVQPDLAATLETIAGGGRGFYQGDLAHELIDTVQRGGGIWELEDLADYQVIEREPIRFEYADFAVTSAPLPSSGGLVLGSVFGQLEAKHYSHLEPQDQLHMWLEANRNAYYQRAIRMGDSDFTQDRGLDLLSPRSIGAMASQIDVETAGDSAALGAVEAGARGDQTTHFSIVDGDGNQAAVTLSINLYFGSGFVAQGTGVLLNNEMDDFSAKPGSPNAYGLVGSAANKIEPGKRPLSSMTPTFFEDDRNLWVIGTPGGSRIITMVGRGMLVAMAGGTVADVVAKGRVHHQYLPDKVFAEPGALSDDEIADLQQRGHQVQELSRQYGDMQVIRWDKATGEVFGASDPRGEGVAAAESQMVDWRLTP